MRSNAARIDSLHQPGVLVNQPRLPQHVRRGVFQLKQNVGGGIIPSVVGRLDLDTVPSLDPFVYLEHNH